MDESPQEIFKTARTVILSRGGFAAGVYENPAVRNQVNAVHKIRPSPLSLELATLSPARMHPVTTIKDF